MYPETTSSPTHQAFEWQLIPIMIRVEKLIEAQAANQWCVFIYHCMPNNNYTYSQIIGSSNVTVERLRIKLCEDVNFVYSTVDAITHWDINHSITSPDWHLKEQVNNPKQHESVKKIVQI